MGNLHEYKIKGIGEGVCAVCGKHSTDPVHGVGVPTSSSYTAAPLGDALRSDFKAYADTDSMHTDQEVVIIDRTPNVGITNPDVRLWIGVCLFILSLVSGIAAMTIGVYPELEIGDAVVSRGVVLANQIISFLTGAFGLAFVSPNVPTKP